MKKKFTIIIIFLLSLLLIGCTNETEEPIKEISTPFIVDKHIKENYLYQQSSTLLISGKCEVGGIINAKLFSNHGNVFSSGSCKTNEEGLFSIVLKTPTGSFEQYKLVISDYHNKYVKTYDGLLFGEINLLLGDCLINEPLDEELTFEQEEASFKNLYILNAKSDLNNWNKVTSKDQISGFMYNLANKLSNSSKFSHMPIGFVNILFENTRIEEWLPLEAVENNLTIKNFLVNNGKYYSAPYQQGQMSYVCNNILSKMYNMSFSNIIFSSGINEFEVFYGKNNNKDYYNVYAKMLLVCLRNISDSFNRYNSFSLIQANSVDVKNINELRNAQTTVSHYIKNINIIPTYDLLEDEKSSYSNLLATRYYDIAIGKRQVSHYANYYINDLEKKIVIEFSNTTSFNFNEDTTIFDVSNLVIYDENSNVIKLEEDKIDVSYNRIIIYLEYEVEDSDDEKTDEEKNLYYNVSKICYAQDNILKGNFIYNVNNIPVIPFKIIID